MKKTNAAFLACITLAGCSQSEKEIINDINNSPSLIFTSISNCESQGYSQSACEKSYKNAYHTSGTVKYADHSSCVTAHKECSRRTVSEYSHSIPVGKIYVPQYKQKAYSFAPIVAWQAIKADINKGVLLYSHSSAGKAIRKDGTVLHLHR